MPKKFYVTLSVREDTEEAGQEKTLIRSNWVFEVPPNKHVKRSMDAESAFLDFKECIRSYFEDD